MRSGDVGTVRRAARDVMSDASLSGSETPRNRTADGGGGGAKPGQAPHTAGRSTDSGDIQVPDSALCDHHSGLHLYITVAYLSPRPRLFYILPVSRHCLLYSKNVVWRNSITELVCLYD